jgi:hypothetical protein
MNMTNIFKVLSRPFPELESLEIRSSHNYNFVKLPDNFILGSPSCLRRLKLRNVELRCLSPLLSTVTGLVELALTLKVAHDTLPEESLIANLHRLSCLRRLELRLPSPLQYANIISDSPRPPTSTRDIVPLPNLIRLVLSGHRIYLETLMAVLAAPSIQYLYAELIGATHAFPISHLCRLICDADHQFRLVRLEFWDCQLGFTAETHSKSVHAQPFRIFIPVPISLEEIGNRLAGPLSTVEELVIRWKITGENRGVQWRGFFNHLRQVKVLQVSWQVALDVAHSFQQNDQDITMDLLPDLELVRWLWHTGAAKTMRLSLMHLSPLLLHGRGWDAP